MAHEKMTRAAQADDERGAGDWGGETVLEFLWAELPDDRDEGAQAAQQAGAEAACEDGLQRALAHYATWLSSWGGPA